MKICKIGGSNGNFRNFWTQNKFSQILSLRAGLAMGNEESTNELPPRTVVHKPEPAPVATPTPAAQRTVAPTRTAPPAMQKVAAPPQDPNFYGKIIVKVLRGVYLAPNNEKREIYVRVGFADATTKKWINEDQTDRYAAIQFDFSQKRSYSDKSTTPKWDYTFEGKLYVNQIVKIEAWDTKTTLKRSGHFLGYVLILQQVSFFRYSLVDWAVLKHWWKNGRSKVERRLEVEEPAFHEKHEKGKPVHLPGIYVTIDYVGERSLSPEDEVFGITSGDVSNFQNNFGKNMEAAWDDMTAGLKSDFASFMGEAPPPGPNNPTTQREEIKARLAAAENQGPTFLGVGKKDVTGAFTPTILK